MTITDAELDEFERITTASTPLTGYGKLEFWQLKGLLGRTTELDDKHWCAYTVPPSVREEEGELIGAITGNGPTSEANARFFAGARGVMLRLISEVRRLNAHDAEQIDRLTLALHALRAHPDFEYTTTEHGRKQYNGERPEGEGWEDNVCKRIPVGDPLRDKVLWGQLDHHSCWERFDWHEEHHWRRRKVASPFTLADVQEGVRILEANNRTPEEIERTAAGAFDVSRAHIEEMDARLAEQRENLESSFLEIRSALKSLAVAPPETSELHMKRIEEAVADGLAILAVEALWVEPLKERTATNFTAVDSRAHIEEMDARLAEQRPVEQKGVSVAARAALREELRITPEDVAKAPPLQVSEQNDLADRLVKVAREQPWLSYADLQDKIPNVHGLSHCGVVLEIFDPDANVNIRARCVGIETHNGVVYLGGVRTHAEELIR